MHFIAKSIPGSNRGKSIGCPTVNLSLDNVPDGLEEGIYACTAKIDAEPLNAVMQFGSRPTFEDTPSCEVHFLDFEPESTPDSLEVEVLEKIRDIKKFDSTEELIAKIQEDIAKARDILSTHDKKA